MHQHGTLFRPLASPASTPSDRANSRADPGGRPNVRPQPGPRRPRTSFAGGLDCTVCGDWQSVRAGQSGIVGEGRNSYRSPPGYPVRADHAARRWKLAIRQDFLTRFYSRPCGLKLELSASLGASACARRRRAQHAVASGAGTRLGHRLRADGLGATARGAREPAGRTAQAALAHRSAAHRRGPCCWCVATTSKTISSTTPHNCSPSCTRSTSTSPRPTSSIRWPSWPTWPASGPSR